MNMNILFTGSKSKMVGGQPLDYLEEYFVIVSLTM